MWEIPTAPNWRGYRWGERTLRPHVERILTDARSTGNERLEQLAERFLRVAT